MASEIILYDLPSRHKGADKLSCFSFNPWKSRMVLNYKQLPYTTEWIEYPDLEAKMKSLGVSPNTPGTAWSDYSSPAIKLPDGTAVMNSANIVEKLEALYPQPGLHLDAKLHVPMTEAVESLAGTIWWDSLALVPKRILNPRSVPYFEESRKAAFGASLEDVAAAKGGPQAWKAAAAPGGPAEKLAKLLTANKQDDGPFALGSRPSYGDFVVASVFECIERISKEDYQRLLELDGSFGKLHDGCRQWLVRDN